MLSKNALAIALIFFSYTVTSIAMETSRTNSYLVKAFKTTLAKSTSKPYTLPVKLHVLLPNDCISEDAKIDYYASCKTKVLANLQRVLKTYEKVYGVQLPKNSPFNTITTTELHYYPDSGKITLKEFLLKHTFSTGLNAHLETQLICSLDSETNNLIPGIPTLCIKDQLLGSEEHVPLATLRDKFPFQDQLHLSGRNIKLTLLLIDAGLRIRAREIAAGKNPSELPDRNQLVRNLYHEDIIKWVEFYLRSKTVEASLS